VPIFSLTVFYSIKVGSLSCKNVHFFLWGKIKYGIKKMFLLYIKVLHVTIFIFPESVLTQKRCLAVKWPVTGCVISYFLDVVPDVHCLIETLHLVCFFHRMIMQQGVNLTANSSNGRRWVSMGRGYFPAR
jgi:hypothetical protein